MNNEHVDSFLELREGCLSRAVGSNREESCDESLTRDEVGFFSGGGETGGVAGV